MAFFKDLGEALKPKTSVDVQKRMLDDEFFFARDVLGNEAVFPPSLEESVAGDWAKLFRFMFDFGKTIRLGVLNSPRNSFKTTLLVAKIVHMICCNRNIRILYCTNTHQNALRVSRAVRNHLLNNELLIRTFGAFGNVKGDEESETWRQDYFYVMGRTTNAVEPTLTVSSVGITKVGNHYDVIIVDDGCDLENTRTADSIQGTIRWFAFLGSLRDKKSSYGPGGVILDVGTRYAEGDLHGWLLGEGKPKDSPYRKYTALVLQAMKDPKWDEERQCFIDPKLNFPAVLTLSLLEEERMNGAAYFSGQYQNDPTSAEDAIFKRHWFRVVPAYDLPRELRYYIFTDFAFEVDETNDRTAIWVVGLDWERTAWVIDFDVGRWALFERVNKVVVLADKYKVEKIAIEKVNSNEGIRAELERQRKLKRLRFSIEDIEGRSTETKQRRIINSLQPRFEGKRIWFIARDVDDMIGVKPEFLTFNAQGQPIGEIVDEFAKFPRAIHDDIPDALSDIDKIEPKNHAFLFPGAYGYGRVNTPQVLGPTTVNGRVMHSWGGPQDAARTTKEESFVERVARERKRSASPWGYGIRS